MRTVEARPGQHQCKDADDTSFLKTAQLTTLHSKQESGARYIEQLERHEPNYHRFPIHTRMNLAMDLVTTENFALPLVSPPPMIAFTSLLA
ncbi:hypothetical protein HBH79_243240 [Parastagonospora nodorum]|nr:hypothetical protein HBH79_243240 [Parastagonospora nodorum]KAH5139316.1 hypothetical protein HBH69_220130 [Parastagonospora nodorum]